MNLTVTQDNLYLFLPGKVASLAQFYAEDHGCTILEALHNIYASPLYVHLSNEGTKLWCLGVRDLYEMFKSNQ